MSDLMNGPENDTFGFVCPICGGRVHMVRATRSENPGEDREQYMDPALQHKFRGNCQCVLGSIGLTWGRRRRSRLRKELVGARVPISTALSVNVRPLHRWIIGAEGLLMAANAHLLESRHDRAGVLLMDHTSNSLLDWAEVEQVAATEGPD
jgi:hypothetical protein